MFIFAGSYERFIFGYSASVDCSQPQELVKRYTFAAHKSAVKCMVASGPYVASGGADDLIHLYDMKAERDLGILMSPCDGAVPCLAFYTPEVRSAPSHMLSGSADGGINIWRCKDWAHLKTMRGHKGSVNSMAVHASGRLALSTARDGAIRMWNLAKGRPTYTAPLEAEAEEVAFLRSGMSYYLLAGNRITVHSTTGEGGLLAAYTAPRRILCTASQDDQLLLLGLEDGSVRLWDTRTSGLVGGWERAHGSRVRGMAILQEGPNKLPAALVTASSDGTIKLWDTRKLGGSGAAAAPAAVVGGGPSGGAAASCTAQVSTGARLTCLAAVDPDVRPVAVKPAIAAAAKGPKKGRKEEWEAGLGDEEQEEEREEANHEGKEKVKKDKSKEDATRREQQIKPGVKAGLQAQRQQPQKQPQKQPQQQRPDKAAWPGQTLWRGKGGRSGGGDEGDPGFEVVPAEPEYDNGDGDDGFGGGGRQQGKAGPRGGPAAGRVAKGQGQRRKRRAGGDWGGEAGEVEGRGWRGADEDSAGPSGRQQQHQGQEGGMRAGKGKERTYQKQQQQTQRPAKKAKTAAGDGGQGGRGSGGGGAERGNRMARKPGAVDGPKKSGAGKFKKVSPSSVR